jgi:hypothetical protein
VSRGTRSRRTGRREEVAIEGPFLVRRFTEETGPRGPPVIGRAESIRLRPVDLDGWWEPLPLPVFRLAERGSAYGCGSAPGFDRLPR